MASHQLSTKWILKRGEWKLTLHGADGTNYPNRSVFKEIILHKKIVFEHFNPYFITTVLFESKGSEINWAMMFETADMREIVTKAHGAEEVRSRMPTGSATILHYKFNLKPDRLRNMKIV